MPAESPTPQLHTHLLTVKAGRDKKPIACRTSDRVRFAVSLAFSAPRASTCMSSMHAVTPTHQSQEPAWLVWRLAFGFSSLTQLNDQGRCQLLGIRLLRSSACIDSWATTVSSHLQLMAPAADVCARTCSKTAGSCVTS